MAKNYPGTRTPWYRMNACFRLVLHYYFETRTILEFEKKVMLSKNFTKKEQKLIIKHWKKEIYPVEKPIAAWMWGLGSEIDLNFNTNLKQLKKSGYQIVKTNKNVKPIK